MKQGPVLYEGKAKIVSQGETGRLIHYFKDSATAFNAQKKAEFPGKGALNLAISEVVFKALTAAQIPHHFIQRLDERSFESMSLQMIPAEVVVRNRVAGSLAQRLQEPEGALLSIPVVEFFLKNDAKGDPLVSEDILVAFYAQRQEDLQECRRLSLAVNQAVRPLFAAAQLELVDFKLEFGRDDEGRLFVADEFSPDTCRLWDVSTGEKFDKDRFRRDQGDLLEGYREVLKRLSQQ
jgi:phosphoribosylaminoimidazole-succinocarboxamide synthase